MPTPTLSGLFLSPGNIFDCASGLHALEAGIGGIILSILKNKKNNSAAKTIPSSDITAKNNIKTDLTQLLGVAHSVFHSTLCEADGYIPFNIKDEKPAKDKLHDLLFNTETNEYTVLDCKRDKHGLTAIALRNIKNKEVFVAIGGLETTPFTNAMKDFNELTRHGLKNQALAFVEFYQKQLHSFKDKKPTIIAQSMGTITALVAATLLGCKTINIETRVPSPDLINHAFKLSQYVYNHINNKANLHCPQDEKAVLNTLLNNVIIINTVTPNWWTACRTPLSPQLDSNFISRLNYYTVNWDPHKKSHTTFLNTTLFGEHRASKSLAQILVNSNSTRFYKPSFIPVNSAQAMFINGPVQSMIYTLLGCTQLLCLSLLLSPTFMLIIHTFVYALLAATVTLLICLMARICYKAITTYCNYIPKWNNENNKLDLTTAVNPRRDQNIMQPEILRTHHSSCRV